ncbi:hypothetical protein B9Z55_005092 [Caenorhabditis nigoni]|uniref:Uncharacterized protein n=2 Tax=Caenorhabditis nigoni TaxID=1611254 RepID=A0A2G5UZB8_9PELO|nr:hypothetical protein B9Z55_005092 [Caenorhabditis nigoni]
MGVDSDSQEKSPRKTSPDPTANPDSRLKVPLFVLEPKATLVRMIAVLIDNQSLSKTIQSEIAMDIIRAAVGWVSSYTLLCLVLRLGDQKIRLLAKRELEIDGLSKHLQEEAEAICQALTYNMDHFENLIQRLASPEVGPSDLQFCQTVDRCLLDFLQFSSELLFHLDLGYGIEIERLHAADVKIQDAFGIMKIDPNRLNQPGKAYYWTMMYRNNLTWITRMNKFVKISKK